MFQTPWEQLLEYACQALEHPLKTKTRWAFIRERVQSRMRYAGCPGIDPASAGCSEFDDVSVGNDRDYYTARAREAAFLTGTITYRLAIMSGKRALNRAPPEEIDTLVRRGFERGNTLEHVDVFTREERDDPAGRKHSYEQVAHLVAPGNRLVSGWIGKELFEQAYDAKQLTGLVINLARGGL